MTRDELKNRLVECFAVLFPRLSREQIPAATHESVEEWDSLASVTLLSMVQEEFQIEVDLTDLERFLSFAATLAYLEERFPAEK